MAKTEKGPFKEDDDVCSVTRYGLHKVECEQYITSHLYDYLYFYVFPGCLD